MKIYTKTGDHGDTSLFGAGRVRKNHLRVCAYGDVDELNSMLGLVGALLESDEVCAALAPILARVQNRLFVIGSMLATPQEAALYTTIPKLTAEDLVFLEVAVDRLASVVPHLHSFILPGGSAVAAQLHVARAVCRRAERSIVALMSESVVDEIAEQYVNRLSDLLFEMARWVNWKLDYKEVEWRGR